MDMTPTAAPSLRPTGDGEAADTSRLFAQVAFNHLLGLQREFAENGVARLSLQARQELTNNFGVVHGGVLMSMLDSAMSSAALSATGFQKAVVTIDMNTAFQKPGRGRLVAHASAQGGGKSVCFCEARIVDEDGEVVARAMGTFRYVKV
ncbi:MAG: PaaI family thioesterase [Burkholderiaceae bacterium]|nr:PaaI family thioesterase [Burkholderiaceae bacterium]